MRSDLLDQRIIKQLNHQVKAGKWATTYLFTGKENERKKALALAFAKALNCSRTVILSPSSEAKDLRVNSAKNPKRDPSASPLNPIDSRTKQSRNRSGFEAASPQDDICKCSVCHRIDEGTFPDVKWYGLDEEASTIKISEVRDFKNWLSFKPSEGKVKVFIFNQAERLTGEAQNALLKSLEEPPPDNVILLLVPKAESLFDTIASRAIEIKVPSFSSQEIKEILIKEAVEKNEAEVLARMAHGDLTRAREFYAEKTFREKNHWIDQLVKNPTSFLEQFQSVSRDELTAVFNFLIEWFRDLLTFHASWDPQYLVHIDKQTLIETLVKDHDFDSLVEILEKINRLKNTLNDYANQKLVLTQTQILLGHFFKE